MPRQPSKRQSVTLIELGQKPHSPPAKQHLTATSTSLRSKPREQQKYATRNSVNKLKSNVPKPNSSVSVLLTSSKPPLQRNPSNKPPMPRITRRQPQQMLPFIVNRRPPTRKLTEFESKPKQNTSLLPKKPRLVSYVNKKRLLVCPPWQAPTQTCPLHLVVQPASSNTS